MKREECMGILLEEIGRVKGRFDMKDRLGEKMERGEKEEEGIAEESARESMATDGRERS